MVEYVKVEDDIMMLCGGLACKYFFRILATVCRVSLAQKFYFLAGGEKARKSSCGDTSTTQKTNIKHLNHENETSHRRAIIHLDTSSRRQSSQEREARQHRQLTEADYFLVSESPRFGRRDNTQNCRTMG